AAIIGYVDYMVDGVSVRVIGGDALRIAEAVRRRRVDHGADDLFIERLLGLRLTHDQVQRGKNFIGGVVDRVGESKLSDLLAGANALPTPAEIDAPGLWVARLELASD
ncbi:MAG TPA: zinc-dependent metalloprotease, partial [Ilumatobacteraceae bacterium]|nr:zinc-dependent metalloprotease [Ilumatobacteraceae bacterium]